MGARQDENRNGQAIDPHMARAAAFKPGENHAAAERRRGAFRQPPAARRDHRKPHRHFRPRAHHDARCLRLGERQGPARFVVGADAPAAAQIARRPVRGDAAQGDRAADRPARGHLRADRQGNRRGAAAHDPRGRHYPGGIRRCARCREERHDERQAADCRTGGAGARGDRHPEAARRLQPRFRLLP